MIRKLIVFYITLNLSILVGGFFVLFFTPLPMGLYVWGLERTGATVTDARGTLYGGVTIGRIEWKDPATGLESVTEGIGFQYSRVFEIFKTRRIEIDHYTIDKVHVRVPAGAKEALAFKALSDGGPAKSGADAKQAAKRPLTPTEETLAKFLETVFSGDRPLIRGFGIGELRVSNTKIALEKAPAAPGAAPATETFEIQQAQYKNLSIGPGFSLGEIHLANAKGEFRARGISVTQEAQKIDEIEGKLKIAYDPDRLRQDLDLSIKLDGSLKQWRELKANVQAVGGKIRARVGPNGMISFSVADVTVRELYAEPFPITNLNLELNETSFMAILSGAVDVRGGFHVGTTPFRFVPVDPSARANGVLLRASAMVGKVLYTVDVSPPSRGGSMMSIPGATPVAPPAARPPLALYSNFSASAQDNLAVLLHGAMYADLDEVKRLQVDTDLKHFDVRTPAAAKRVVRAPAKNAEKKPNRVPASKRR